MKGIVVCPQPRAADVGVEILESGGNAFDAALFLGDGAFLPNLLDVFFPGQVDLLLALGVEYVETDFTRQQGRAIKSQSPLPHDV